MHQVLLVIKDISTTSSRYMKCDCNSVDKIETLNVKCEREIEIFPTSSPQETWFQCAHITQEADAGKSRKAHWKWI